MVVAGLLVWLIFLRPFWGIPFNASRHGRVPLTPPWALECWLWEDDGNTAAAVRELLDGYRRHDLPVRTILIDSPWSERYNDFKVDEERYPEPEQFFRDLQQEGYRVVLWMTCMVNRRNKDTRFRESAEFYETAKARGYLAGHGAEVRWWKGTGGFIDYSHPEAMKWWHGLQRQVLDWGVDGWKLDGADTLFSSRVGRVPLPFNRTHAGWMSTRRYMDHYAREEYRHGLERNPEFVTLIRAKDGPWAHPEGFAPLDAAPVTWVGDNRHTWKAADRGLEAALRDILASARLGYCVIGSDVAGYHGRSNPDDISAATAAQLGRLERQVTGREAEGPERRQSDLEGAASSADSAAGNDAIAPNLYIRWAQFSTFCGLFLNGGHGERRLWKRTAAELEIIRKFSWLHTELVPYLYSHVVECHRGGRPLMRPLPQGRFQYLLGDDLLIAPIHEDKTLREVTLPPGRWRYWFNPHEAWEGPATIRRDFPFDEYPVFIREGALIPLNVCRVYTGLGDRDSAGFITWLIHPGGTNRFTLWHPETHPDPQSTTLTMDATATRLRLTFSGRPAAHRLRILSPHPPARVSGGGRELGGEAWNYDARRRLVLVQVGKDAPSWFEIAWQ
jgi:alpha-D-xyloside xylohydrolase